MIDYDFLKEIRDQEANQVLAWFPAKGSVLEIGAGAGWQSKFFADRGYEVSAIDLEESQYLAHKVFPVQIYDGHSIPFPDASFDVVFSSNVLEHVAHIDSFLQEIHRVLKPGGKAIHALPSGAYRFWRNLAHYVWILKAFAGMDRPAPAAPVSAGGDTQSHAPQEGWMAPPASAPAQRPTFMQKIHTALFPERHGEFGNCITEIYFFSKFRWRPAFRKAGFILRAHDPMGLLYSGHNILGRKLSLSARHTLSRLCGSSCLLYVMEKPAD